MEIFSRTTAQLSTKLCTKHPWVKGSQDFANEGLFNSPKVDFDFFLLINVMV